MRLGGAFAFPVSLVFVWMCGLLHKGLRTMPFALGAGFMECTFAFGQGLVAQPKYGLFDEVFGAAPFHCSHSLWPPHSLVCVAG